MIEAIIVAISNFFSKILRTYKKVNTTVVNAVDNVNTQIYSAKNTISSTVSITLSNVSHINYFKNRVIGEFLRIIVELVSYVYDNESDKYVVYLVRRNTKLTMEYIKLSKDKEDSKDADITYTIINKLISKRGTTTYVGNTSQVVLNVTDAVSDCLYSALEEGKAPLYVVNVLDNINMSVYHTTYYNECWIIASKLIKRRVNTYIKIPIEDDIKFIDSLVQMAGTHLFMSYFKSVDNPFYRMYYKDTDNNSIVKSINDFNSKVYNTDKILDISYDSSDKSDAILTRINTSNNYILKYYGIIIKFTSKTISNTTTAKSIMDRFNYKLSEEILKSNDKIIRDNFLFYIFSTGIASTLLSKDDISKEIPSDVIINDINDSVENTVIEDMNELGFKEDDSGSFISKLFKESVESIVTSSIEGKIVVPTKAVVTHPIVIQDIPTEVSIDAITELEPTISVESTMKPLIDWNIEDCTDFLCNENCVTPKGIERQDILNRLLYLQQKRIASGNIEDGEDYEE